MFIPGYRFRFGWFLFAFAVGILYIYLVKPSPPIFYKYPTPYNVGKIIYEDDTGGCYKFKLEKLECPKDKESIEPQPIV